jgi:hypothetical protein
MVAEAAFWKLSQNDLKVQASHGYIARLCLNVFISTHCSLQPLFSLQSTEFWLVNSLSALSANGVYYLDIPNIWIFPLLGWVPNKQNLDASRIILKRMTVRECGREYHLSCYPSSSWSQGTLRAMTCPLLKTNSLCSSVTQSLTVGWSDAWKHSCLIQLRGIL